MILCALMGLMLQSNAQAPIRINSGEVIASGIKRHDAGKYKEAVALYSQVPRNDTNYALALYELMLSYRADSSFGKARQACETALRLPNNDYELQVLNTYGSTFDDEGNQERALRVYDSALLKYPASQLLRLNKGIALLRARKPSEAETLFQQLLLENPYYSSAHFRLAQCALQRGEIVPALFSLFTYLLVTPSGPYANYAIQYLNLISKGDTEVVKYVDARSSADEAFGVAEQILLSKIALDKAYKIKTSFDDPIIRQLQVVMEKTTYDEDSKNFWMQYYVPLFKTIYTDDQFEPLVYHAFSGVNLEPIQRYVKKNSKEIKSAVTFVVQKLNPIRSTRELHAARRKAAPELYHFNDDGDFAGIGTMDGKGNLSGPWKFYHTNGNLKSTGAYNEKSEKEGTWHYFAANGLPTGFDTWIAGKQTGDDVTYNSYGTITAKAQYKNGELHGEKETFYGIGHLYTKATYADGKMSGPYTAYYSNGRKKVEATYKDDELDGTYKTYYKTGQLESEGLYSKGKFEGPYKLYHENGQVSKTGAYKAGKLQGEEKEFHPNGVLKKLHTYVDDVLEGDEKEYNAEGGLIEKLAYKGGQAQGLAEYYGPDGKLFSTFLFDKNILKTARYFDKSGNEISRSERKDKTITLTAFDADGFKVSTITYNDAAARLNSDTYFYSSGQVRETNPYKDGKLDGVSTGYYANGKKEYAIQYKGGEKDGLATYYFQNGNIKSQGWYDKGDLVDTWTNYNEKGVVVSRTSYVNDDINGYSETYNAGGKLQDEEVYRNGWLTAVNQYDSAGNRIHATEFKNGNGNYSGIHFNGKTSYEGSYVQGEFQGLFKSYYFDGSPAVVKTYDRGLLQGDHTEYYYGGVVATSGKYKNGERTGRWKTFTTDGKLYKEENYTDGALDGKRIYYYPNGKIEREFDYKRGDRDGVMKRYADDGQLAFVLYFKDDVITGYAYADKSGQLVPVKPLPGGNGRVQTFYASGAKSAEMEYVANLLNGPHKLYFPNGKLYYETTEDYNLSNGKLMEYYSNGALKKQYNYLQDNEDGPYKEYYENGKLREEGAYDNGLLQGDVRFYDATGKLTETRTYYYGTLLKANKPTK